jgi:hypothetical protein
MTNHYQSNREVFWDEVYFEFRSKDDVRYGQAAFNVLVRMYPKLAEQIRGTDKDPFYSRNEEDPRWIAFDHFIQDNITDERLENF